MRLVFGIMSNTPLPGDEPFGRETRYFAKICALARDRDILAYIFWPEAVEVQQGLIRGVAWADDGCWHSGTYPFPDVVYDRFHSAACPGPYVEAVRSEIIRRGAQFINSPGFAALVRNKWLVHKTLSHDPVLKRHLPETRVPWSAHDVTHMLCEFGLVYLKPATGQQSNGIICLARSPAGIDCSFRTPDGSIRVVRASDVEEALYLLPLGRGEDYIVQQGIKPALFMGQRFEMRIMMHKDGRSRWLRTGMVIRAGTRSPHFIAPGCERHFRPSTVIPKVFASRAEEVLESARGLARVVPGILESHSDRGGELAVDTIIDGSGKPWLLEVNSRPASLFLNVGAVRLRNLRIQRILDYATSLH